MRTTLSVLVLLLVCLGEIGTAHADRDIVFAARYYLPPGNHGTSHFHLYRINADGTGKTQITSGTADDYAPKWSPDGRKILFMRDGQGVCLVEAGGGTVRTVRVCPPSDSEGWGVARWLPDGKMVSIGHTWVLKAGSSSEVLEIDTRTGKTRRIADVFDERLSPDGRYAFQSNDTVYRVQDRRTGAVVSLPDALQNAVWADAHTLVGLGMDTATDHSFVRSVGADGRQERRMELHFPPAYAGSGDDDPAERGGVVLQGPKGSLVFALNNHNSTVGVDNLFFTLPRDGAVMSYIMEGQFLAWSPGGRQFAVAPGRDTTDYERRPFPFADDAGRYRQVWYVPLFVRAAAGGPMRQITPRLSWVVGADWRRGGRSAAEH